MSQTVALIVHAVMDSPDHFRDRGDHITNGYYQVALDGSRYGMGISNYTADGSEREMLLKAVASWKQDTGWTPPSEQSKPTHAPAQKRFTTFDEYSRKTYEEFSRTVRSNLKSFSIHRDPNTLSNGLQSAISILDNAIRQIDAVNADAK